MQRYATSHGDPGTSGAVSSWSTSPGPTTKSRLAPVSGDRRDSTGGSTSTGVGLSSRYVGSPTGSNVGALSPSGPSRTPKGVLASRRPMVALNQSSRNTSPQVLDRRPLGDTSPSGDPLSRMAALLQAQDDGSAQQLRDNQTLASALQSAVAELQGLRSQLQEIPPPPVKHRPGLPPFYWVPSQDYIKEFDVQGGYGEFVTKKGDFEDEGWVIPVSGSMKMVLGGIYRYSIKIVRKSMNRPQLQFGIHGPAHQKPWRLITTSRCSTSRDDEPWHDRPQGDRSVDAGSIIHVQIDCTCRRIPFATLEYALDDGPYEIVFQDIPVPPASYLIPVVSMGGDGSCVQVMPI
mmetsp:Transcript_105082/g.240773  ORF Transcript_105082/g.240773 Transcript_105082/m.240773 type:complete len:347 (+) Transcript_105082:19-1059(+)